MTQSALTNISKVRRSQNHSGVSVNDESNLLERSYLSNTILMGQSKEEIG